MLPTARGVWVGCDESLTGFHARHTGQNSLGRGPILLCKSALYNFSTQLPSTSSFLTRDVNDAQHDGQHFAQSTGIQ